MERLVGIVFSNRVKLLEVDRKPKYLHGVNCRQNCHSVGLIRPDVSVLSEIATGRMYSLTPKSLSSNDGRWWGRQSCFQEKRPPIWKRKLLSTLRDGRMEGQGRLGKDHKRNRDTSRSPLSVDEQ